MKRFVRMTTVSALLLVLSGSVLSVSAEAQTTVRTNGYGNNVPSTTSIVLNDASGEAVEIGSEINYDTDIADLLSTIDTGEMNASKSGAFASVEDAENGIAKLTFDAAGKQLDISYDIVLVLDESGSMNSTMSPNQSVGAHTLTSTCLNEDHYYCIPASLGFGNTEDIYIKLSDYGTSAFNTWAGIPDSVWDKIKEQYHLSSISLNQWQPWKHHYFYDANTKTYTLIPETATGNKYDSPIEEDGTCYDRMMMEKEQASALASTILGSNDDARIAVVGFNKQAYQYCGLTDSIDTVNAGLKNYQGDDNTNYTSALNMAADILEAREDQSRSAYVIFVTDGAPYYGTGAQAQADADGQKASIDRLKDTGAIIYAVGIKSDSLNVLQTIASGNAYCMDCSDVDEFVEYLGMIAENVISSARGELVDTIGTDYELLIDEDHPLCVNGKAYTSLDALPSSIVYNASEKAVTWSLPSIDENGARLSFYVQLDEDKRSLDAGVREYATNQQAVLNYHQAIEKDNKIVLEEETETVSMPSPVVVYQSSQFPAVLNSDRMNNEDPSLMGEMVEHDDTITYTITLTNDGSLDGNNLVIRNPLPNNTEFVSVDHDGIWNAEQGYTAWNIDSLAAGESISVHFTVKVTADTRHEPQEVITDSFVWGWGTDQDYQESDPPCIGNTLKNPTPVSIDPVTPSTPQDTGITDAVPDTADHSADFMLYASLLLISVCGACGCAMFIKKHS